MNVTFSVVCIIHVLCSLTFLWLLFCCHDQIILFCGFLEFVISKIQKRPSYLPGDYVGSAELFDGQGDELWRSYQASAHCLRKLFASWSSSPGGSLTLRVEVTPPCLC